LSWVARLLKRWLRSKRQKQIPPLRCGMTSEWRAKWVRGKGGASSYCLRLFLVRLVVVRMNGCLSDSVGCFQWVERCLAKGGRAGLDNPPCHDRTVSRMGHPIGRCLLRMVIETGLEVV
jgi:hypothetical protein